MYSLDWLKSEKLIYQKKNNNLLKLFKYTPTLNKICLMAYALLFLKARTQFILGPSSKYHLIVVCFLSFYHTGFAQTWALHQGVQILIKQKTKTTTTKKHKKKTQNFLAEFLFKYGVP